MPTSAINIFSASEQFRMRQLQVFNWGTFSDIHDIPIATRGFLFVGRSGAGKSTLLDAFSALLTPPRWIDFNAAAREADRSGRDRNLVTYIRGAWAEQKDDDSGEIATRYLRAGTTWSALALSYQNTQNQNITLVQVFWLRGSANGNADVKRHYLIFERPFDLRELEDFSQSNFDVRKLKQKFSDAFTRDEFRPYCDRFSRLFGIENEMALRLLHKTQSAKNLGDLNTFLRDFMLDKPETFAVADRLVSEFGELNAAHQAVVIAREQIQTLTPARLQYEQMQSLQVHKNALNELQQGINNYCQFRCIDLLKQSIATLNIQADGIAGEIAQKQSIYDNNTAALRDLEQQHRALGGDRIEQWEAEKSNQEQQRAERLRKRNQAQDACSHLGWTLSDTPQGFAELVGNARQEIEARKQHSSQIREQHIQLAGQERDADAAFKKAKNEIAALQRQPSNVPALMLDLRREIANAINISENMLPFVGELIEVKPAESQWQGAIERVLYGFALSLLVDERHYNALNTYVNTANLGRRLIYYRTGRIDIFQTKPVGQNSLMLKLNIKEGHYTEWLQTELRQRFDYACVDSLQAFRNTDRALTKEGQIKHNKIRHEKDDRHRVDDRSHWVLGFDNREKLKIFEQQAQQLAETIAHLQRQIVVLKEKEDKQDNRVIHCQTLVNLQWQEIDLAPLLTRIDTLEKLIKETRESNIALQDLSAKINHQKEKCDDADKNLRQANVKQDQIKENITVADQKLTALQQDPTIIPLTLHQTRGLDERFEQLAVTITLDNLDKLTTSVVQQMSKELETVNKQIHDCTEIIKNQFAHFLREWPAESANLGAALDFAPDFFAKLTQLERDGLPAHEHRFFELLQNQSHQNLTALSTYLNDARKSILERMDMVNNSLSQVPFNQSAGQCTYLRIEATDRQLPEVREFKQDILQTLNHALSENRELAESRFLALRRLVERLANQDPAQKRWRESVLDVRQHVEFIGREMDESGVEVEIYRSGAGKSGGQRQKLATTCLAAALRYQLGGHDHGIPLYAAVVLDEAFDKADNEFTALAMNIFTNFGFQMIIATPLKSVMTLESFIGGACFVDITDRRTSGVLLIEYDNEHQRLKLPEHAHREMVDEAA